jgi:hypothetical protein
MTNSARRDSVRRWRVSPSFVISLFALVIATSTGAYAAVTIAPKNSVVSKSIKNQAVKTKDLAASAVSTKKLKNSSVDGAKIADGSVGADDIGAGQIGLEDMSSAAKNSLNQAGAAFSRHFEIGGPVPTTMTPIASINLTAGSYVLTSKAQIDTSDGADIVECDLVAGSSTDRSFVQGGSAHQSQIITNSLVVTLTTGGTVVWQCQTYGGGAISQGRMTAMAVSSLDNQP